jgi:hypothetical protein
MWEEFEMDLEMIGKITIDTGWGVITVRDECCGTEKE